MILLDTHAWIWWISEPERLSEPARQRIETERTRGGFHVSAISAWEVALLVAQGRLELRSSAADWVSRCRTLPFLHFVPVDETIAVASVDLPPPLHADPADRILVATARVLGATLVTRDARLLEYPHVQTLW